MYSFNKQEIERKISEGRGQEKVGRNYVPWVKINEFSSIGRATRVVGQKTKRIHHLHSDNQFRAFLIFEWCDFVIDIRESYPLLDIMEVVDDKENLRLDKFCNKTTGDLAVITTNFLLTVRDSDGRVKEIARTVKNYSELAKKITIEKLEIERRYWSAKGIDWKVITDKQLPRQFCKNIEWVREALIDTQCNDIDGILKADDLLKVIINNNQLTIKDILKKFDTEYKLDNGTGLFLFRYLIGKKMIKINMNVPIDLRKRPMELIL